MNIRRITGFALAAVLGGSATMLATAGPEEGLVDPATGAMFHSVTSIPVARYEAIVVSPTVGPEQGVTAQFMIRAPDATGSVQDFVFHIPPGETFELTFPEGWSPSGGALLYSFSAVRFAAWGISAQGLVRFEPIEPDANRDAMDRARAREWERLLRMKMRRER